MSGRSGAGAARSGRGSRHIEGLLRRWCRSPRVIRRNTFYLIGRCAWALAACLLLDVVIALGVLTLEECRIDLAKAPVELEPEELRVPSAISFLCIRGRV